MQMTAFGYFFSGNCLITLKKENKTKSFRFFFSRLLYDGGRVTVRMGRQAKRPRDTEPAVVAAFCVSLVFFRFFGGGRPSLEATRREASR
jgi:hypothetical protein